MVQVLIVEDERSIRQGIANRIPWQELGVDSVLSAENAEEALKLTMQYPPDIIISDIRMPGMYGTELCRFYREKFPDIQIIFISGYSDKDYLRTAIDLQVIDYIEKPIDKEKLTAALRRAVLALGRARQQNTGLIYSLSREGNSAYLSDAGHFFLKGTSGTEEQLHYLFFILQFPQGTHPEVHSPARDNADAADHALSDSLNSLKQQVPELLSPWMSDTEAARRIYLLAALCPWSDGMKESLARPLAEGLPCFVSLGDDACDAPSLLRSFRAARDRLWQLSWRGWNSFALSDENSALELPVLSPEDTGRFVRMIGDRKEADAILFADGLCSRLKSQRAPLNYEVRSAFIELDREISGSAGKASGLRVPQNTAPGTPVPEELTDALTLKELRDYVCRHIRALCASEPEVPQQIVQVRQVLDLIEENLSDSELSIQRLSDAVFLSPAYLSTVFKKSTGLTIGQYLASRRVEKACELLENPEYKWYQIAGMVGYNDPDYFTRVFRRHTGMSPMDYRRHA